GGQLATRGGPVDRGDASIGPETGNLGGHGRYSNMARDVALTLAGGGNRALVQTGILRRWWPALEPRIAVLAACSAGASMAVSLLSGRELEASAYWLGRRAGVSRNVDWSLLA